METGEQIQETTDVTTPPSGDPDQIVDAGQKPEGQQEKPQLSEKEKALIQARDDNARKLREEQERNKRLEQELYLRNQKPGPEEEIDLDMPLSLRDLYAFEEKKTKKEQERKQREYQQAQEIKIEKSVKAAKEKYKDSEYNYDWCLDYALEHFPNEDLAAISTSSNPGEYLVRLVMSQPENRDKISANDKQKIVKDTINTINENLNTPGTLSGTGGANRTIDTIKQYDKMSGQDFISKMDAIIASKE